MVLHSFLAQYFEPSIAYIFSFTWEIPLSLSLKHHKANNDVFSILWLQLHVLCAPLGVLVAVVDGCTVRTTWERHSVLRDTWGLSGESGVRCKSDARRCKLSSARVLNVFSRLLIHGMPSGCARWRLGRFVFLNQQNAGYESKLSYLETWTKKLRELEYIYPFFPPTPSFSFPPVLNTLPASWTILTSCDWHETTPLVPKHTW